MVVLWSDIVLAAAMTAYAVVSITGVYLQTRWHLYELLVGKKYTTFLHTVFEGLTFAEFLVVASIVVVTGKKSLPFITLGATIVAYALWRLSSLVRQNGTKRLGQVRFFGAKQQIWSPKTPFYAQKPLAEFCLLLLGLGVLAQRAAFLMCIALLVVRFWVFWVLSS